MNKMSSGLFGWRLQINLWILCLGAIGCADKVADSDNLDFESDIGSKGDGDADSDSDADGDTDADTDADADTDGDADTDVDADADGDADTGDADSDVDADADVDTDADSDADGDSAVFNVTAELASDENPNAPGTIGIVTWSVSKNPLTKAHIEFGLDASYGMTAPVDLNEAGYRTLLLGMKPNRDYHFRVVAETAGATYTSDDYTLSTGPSTNLVTVADFNIIDETRRERGFIISELFQSGMSIPGQSGGVAFIIDPDGEIVWWYRSSLNSLAGARMSADGKSMWVVISGLNGAALERITMDTLDTQIYDNVGASHGITPVSGDTMAYLDYSESDCNSIFEINSAGETVEIFESQDYLSGQCHGNAVRYSAAENVYTFSDHMNDVFVVGRDGSLKWRLTDKVGSNSTWGGQQHGHHLLDDSIIIFANNGGQGGAAAIEYDLNGTQVWKADEGIATTNLGDVQRLPGGNTLITYSTSSVIHEVDPSGNAVLTIDMGSTMGYAVWLPNLYSPEADCEM